jgi:CheY-like chemotaxis protein
LSTVLVIDDDVQFLDSVDGMLTESGYHVLRAADGPEAVSLLEEHREGIGLAIVDLSLPGLSGFEIIGALSRRPNSLKIIATTGVYRESQLEVAGILGAHATIRKPAPGSPLPKAEWLGTVRTLIGPANAKSARAGLPESAEREMESSDGEERS